jgi:hypothetical protein
VEAIDSRRGREHAGGDGGGLTGVTRVHGSGSRGHGSQFLRSPSHRGGDAPGGGRPFGVGVDGGDGASCGPWRHARGIPAGHQCRRSLQRHRRMQAPLTVPSNAGGLRRGVRCTRAKRMAPPLSRCSPNRRSSMVR